MPRVKPSALKLICMQMIRSVTRLLKHYAAPRRAVLMSGSSSMDSGRVTSSSDTDPP